MNQLYAIVLRLAAQRPGAIPADHGVQARGAMFKLIEQGNETLSQQWHDANEPKPFTVSLLEGGRRGPDNALHFAEGDQAHWRFTLLREAGFRAILDSYLKSARQAQVRIGAVQFVITDAFASTEGHPESGAISPEALHARWQVDPDTLPDVIRLDFISPTVFNRGQDKTGYHYQTLPEPRYLFSTLKKKWDRIYGSQTPDSFDDWVEQNVVVAQHDIQTRRASINKQRTAQAFTGSVVYELWGDDRTHWPFVNLLADLTFWTGVGYQTTTGLGQVRPMEAKRLFGNGRE